MKFLPRPADFLDKLIMERLSIPERIDPNSRIGDAAAEDQWEKRRQNRRQKAKAPAPLASEALAETDDETHQLDEHA